VFFFVVLGEKSSDFCFRLCCVIIQGEACSRSGCGVAAGALVPAQPGFLEAAASVVVSSAGRRSQEGRRRARAEQGWHVREDKHGQRPDRSQGGPDGVRRLRGALRCRQQALPRPARRYVSHFTPCRSSRGYVPRLITRKYRHTAQPRGIRPTRRRMRR
jgi:hypothetical protein